MGSSTSDKLNLGKPFAVELPGYYRLVDGVPKMTINESELDMKKDVYVGDRNRKEYREKRQEATGGEKPEDTRVHDELKEETDEDPESTEE